MGSQSGVARRAKGILWLGRSTLALHRTTYSADTRESFFAREAHIKGMQPLENLPLGSSMNLKRFPAILILSVLFTGTLMSRGLSELVADSQQQPQPGPTSARRVLAEGGGGLEQLLVDDIAVEVFDSAMQDDRHDDVPTLVASGSSFAERLHTVRTYTLPSRDTWQHSRCSLPDPRTDQTWTGRLRVHADGIAMRRINVFCVFESG